MTHKDKHDILFISLLIIIIALACCSCKSVRYVEVERVHTDTTYITKHQRDSIWLHDSIHVKEKLSGDTLFLEVEKWHTKYVEKQVHDTTYVSKSDSIPIPYPVEKKLTWWQGTKIKFGGIAMGVVFALLLLGIVWILRKLHIIKI